MIHEVLAEYRSKEDRYFELCEKDIVKTNMSVQRKMSIVVAAIFLAMIIISKVIIRGFIIHSLYYLLFAFIIAFFITNQILVNKKLSFKACRRESLVAYGILYLGCIFIDSMTAGPETPSVLFPFFLIIFVAIYIDRLKIYILFEFTLSVIFCVLVVINKVSFFYSRDAFQIFTSLIVSGIVAVLIQKLRISMALNNAELEQLSEKAAEAEAEAIAANSAKSQFLSQMSHEIRTPINAILGMNELIIREYDDDNLLKYSHNIKSAGNTLLSLINDVLDFSKIEAGKMELYNVEYDLAGTIAELISMVDERARNKGLDLQITVNEEMPHLLYGDNVRLKQIILNILTNAIKYTEKGSIHMDVDYISSGHLDINGTIGLKISVSDTGIGIRDEDMTRLFSPFERLEEVRNRNVEGTGLGMSIVQKLLALMNSELMVRSEYGKGSTFSFTVQQETRSWDPIGDFHETYEKLIKSEDNYRQLFEAPEAKILIVDDNEINLVVTKSLIQDTKIQIVTATSGKEALKICDEQEFDLLLIDHRMPGMDGMEMLWRLRSNEKSPNCNKPCVVLTANAFSGAREVYKNSGFEDYLSKPIIGDALEKVLLELLPSDKVIKTDGKDYKKHIPTKSVKYEPSMAQVKPETIVDIREDYSDDPDLYAAIGLLMKRANIIAKES
ncbi:ATP-binding protein [Butyrivibrio sp. MB2005]|uniref:ATP-binding protein n=1 Tax=Butyrivibrio sp. MB2005 TaxID=1280678 RepID=UPI0003FAEE7F|nr:ATP-binding protein [Butyrivibrio sp. MB2005]